VITDHFFRKSLSGHIHTHTPDQLLYLDHQTSQ